MDKGIKRSVESPILAIPEGVEFGLEVLESSVSNRLVLTCSHKVSLTCVWEMIFLPSHLCRMNLPPAWYPLLATVRPALVRLCAVRQISVRMFLACRAEWEKSTVEQFKLAILSYEKRHRRAYTSCVQVRSTTYAVLCHDPEESEKDQASKGLFFSRRMRKEVKTWIGW